MKRAVELRRSSASCLTSTNGQTTIYYGCVEERMLSIHSIVVKTGCTGKLKCVVSMDKTTRPIMKNLSIVALAFAIPVSCVYIYSHRDDLEVHRYFSVCVEQALCLFCKLFLSRHQTAYLGLRGLQ